MPTLVVTTAAAHKGFGPQFVLVHLRLTEENLTMDDAYQRLFPTPSGFSEADYLAFLAQRVPQDLGEQLTRDAHPDLMMDKYVELDDLMRPLSSHSFPADCASRSIPIFRLTGILEYTLSGYALDIEKNEKPSDPYKQIYIASFYLYCGLRRISDPCAYICALLVLVKAAGRVPLEGQLQVSRFISSLVPIIPNEIVSNPAPLSSAFIALSLIVANAANELSLLAERTMRHENFAQAWKEKEEEESEGRHPSIEAMKVLRQAVSTFFGASGTIEQIAERFREAGESTTKKG